MESDTEGTFLSAQLSCRYFHPGGIVSGVLRLSTSAQTPSAATEIASVVAQIHAHVTVDSNLLTLPVVQLQSPRRPSLTSQSSAQNSEIMEEGSQSTFPQQHERQSPWDKMQASLPDVRQFSGDSGTCIYKSPPSVIVTDINIAPTAPELTSNGGGEETSKRCSREFAISLPEKACPTFRGKSARVFYVLTITAQCAMAESDPVSLHLPFEVYASEHLFSSDTLASAEKYAAAMNGKETTQQAPTSNPRQPIRKDRSTSLSVAPVGVRKGSEIPFELRPSLMHGRVETELLQRAQTSIFTIGKDSSHLVRFLLTKQYYQPGEMLLGVFDFSRSSIPCYEVSATLCLEETLSTMSLEPSKVVHSKIYGTFHEHTTSVLQTSVRFGIPQDALPTIRTDLVCFQWLLRFEFSAGSSPVRGEDGLTNAATAQQTFRWQVPIVIKPTRATERGHFANIPHKLFSGSTRSIKVV